MTVGKIVEGEVCKVGPKEVELTLLDGRVGVVPAADFDTAPSVGVTVAAALLAREDPRGRPVLSASWARKQQAWERIEAARSSSESISGAVTKKVKGGVVVDVGRERSCRARSSPRTSRWRPQRSSAPPST